MRVTGVLDEHQLERELERASVALVSQRYEGADFNLPSKLMNFMARGLPVIAAVRPDSEVARIVRASQGGWVTEAEDAREFATLVAAVLRSPRDRHRRGEAALRSARQHFDPVRVGSQFEEMLLSAAASPRGELLSQ